MPDLFFHLASVSYPGNKIERFKITLMILGTFLPDITGRVTGIVFEYFGFKEFRWIIPLHTPLGIILTLILITYIFEESLRIIAFKFLSIGAWIHFFWDILQEQFYHSDYYLFYPFSKYTPRIDLFYFNDSVYLFPFLLIYILYFIFRHYLQKVNYRAI